jgi:Sigma 54 modulation protein / S30EA ribosomal protein
LKVQVNSDKNIMVDTRVKAFVRDKTDRALARFKRKLTRVEFHLSDVNSHKYGTHDKRCMIEARPAAGRPLAVTALAGTVRSAIQGSLAKLKSALEKHFGRSTAHEKAIRKHVASARGRVKPAARPLKKAVAARKKAKQAVAKTTAAKKASPKKKAIYQARRKSWPARRTARAAA